MSLDDTDRDEVIRLVSERLALEQQQRNWLFAHVRHPDFPRKVAHENDSHRLAAAAVDAALKHGATYEPRWIVALLGGLVQTEWVVSVAERMRNEPLPPVDNPFSSRRLHHGWAFLNRSKLRGVLETSLVPAAKSVLVVNGPAKSGKTYTSDFIQHLCRSASAAHALGPGDPFDNVSLELEEDEGSVYGQEQLATDLVSGMEQPSTPPSPAGDQRDRELANWIFGAAASSQRRWWWVFDGFCNEDLPKDTKALLGRLLKRVAKGGPAGNRVRIVLVDYRDPLPDPVAIHAEEDELGPPSGVGELYVREYFDEFFGTGGVEPEALQLVTDQVLADLPDGDERLRMLMVRIHDATRKLENQGPGDA